MPNCLIRILFLFLSISSVSFAVGHESENNRHNGRKRKTSPRHEMAFKSQKWSLAQDNIALGQEMEIFNNIFLRVYFGSSSVTDAELLVNAQFLFQRRPDLFEIEKQSISPLSYLIFSKLAEIDCRDTAFLGELAHIIDTPNIQNSPGFNSSHTIIDLDTISDDILIPRDTAASNISNPSRSPDINLTSNDEQPDRNHETSHTDWMDLLGSDFDSIINDFEQIIGSTPNNHTPPNTTPTEPKKADFVPTNLSPATGIIGKSHFQVDFLRTPQKSLNRSQRFYTPEFFPLEKLSGGKANSASVIKVTNLADGKLKLLSVNSTNLKDALRITFVRVSKNQDVFVPRETQGGRLVLVMAASEESFAPTLVNEHYDVLLCPCLPHVDKVAWVNIFMASFELGVAKFMALDNDIFGIYTRRKLPSWEEVYGLYQMEAGNKNHAILSSSSVKPGQERLIGDSNQIITTPNSYGYKMFFINAHALKERIENPRYLTPHDANLGMEEVFFQEIAKQTGLTIGKITKQSIVLKKAVNRAFASPKKEKNTGAENWYTAVAPQEFPEFYKNAYGSIKLLVKRSQRIHEKEDEQIKNADLAALSTQLNQRPNQIAAPVLRQPDRSERVITKSSKKKNQNRTPSSPTVLNSVHEIDFSFATLLNDTINEIEEDAEFYNTLRVPQKAALNSIKNHFSTAQPLSLQAHLDIATGVGKTRVFSLITSRLLQKMEHYLREHQSNKRHILIVTPSLELDAQTFKDPHLQQKSILVDAENISQRLLFLNNHFNNENAEPRIVIICQRSLAILLSNEESNQLLDKFFLTVFDEMHSMKDDLLHVVKDYSERSKTPMLGFSATPKNKQAFFGGTPIFRFNSNQGVKNGLLSPWENILLPADSFSDIEKTKASIDKILGNLYGNPAEQQRRGIIWVKRVKDAKEIVEHINQTQENLRDKIKAYHSYLSKDERAQLVDNLANGVLKILVAVQTLKEGFDCPGVSFALLAKKKINLSAFIQMRGRALRKSPEHNHTALIYFAEGTLTDGEHDDEIFCNAQSPTELNPSQQEFTIVSNSTIHNIDPNDWLVVPFPLVTSLDEAMKFAAYFHHFDSRNRVFENIRKEIYKKPDAREIRERMRLTSTYGTLNTKIDGFYNFLFNKSKMDLSLPTPRATVYEESFADGNRLVYKYLRSRHGHPRGEVIKLLQKVRTVRNPHGTEQLELHYELLIPRQ